MEASKNIINAGTPDPIKEAAFDQAQYPILIFSEINPEDEYIDLSNKNI